MRVKLNANGYSKIYESETISIVGSYNDDEEVQKFIANKGIIEPEFTDAELLKRVKDEKISLISADAADAVALIVGSVEEQIELLESHNYLLERKFDAVITSDEVKELTRIKKLWDDVAKLKKAKEDKKSLIDSAKTIDDVKAL